MININTQFKPGIDTSVLKQVSQEILKRAAERTGNSTGTLSKPADMGVDLYKGGVDPTTARQIAMNNSGLQIQTNQNILASVNFLNSQAAQRTAADGKINIAINELPSEVKDTKAPQFNKLVSLSAGKDKHGSNQKYNGELLEFKKDEKQEEPNIFS
jgi:hypothetical protein